MVFEDNSLKNLHDGLRDMGLDTRILEGYTRVGWIPKKFQFYGMSVQPWNVPKILGTIEIRNSPVRCIHLIREWTEASWHRQFLDKRQYEVCYRNIYVVLDSNIYDMNEYREINSIRVKSGLLPKSMVNVKWESEKDDKLLKYLNADTLLNLDLAKLSEDITVRSFLEYLLWEISSSHIRIRKNPFRISVNMTPSRLQWNCYEKIARYLNQRRD